MRSFTVSTKRVRQILPKIKPRCSLLNQNLLYTFSYDKTTHSRRLAISPTRRQCDSWRTATVVKYAFEHTRISCSPVRFGVFLCCSRSQSLVSTLLFFQKHLNSTATNSIFIIENWNATVFWAKRKSDRENIQAETQRRTDDVADVNSCWFAEKKKTESREKKNSSTNKLLGLTPLAKSDCEKQTKKGTWKYYVWKRVSQVKTIFHQMTEVSVAAPRQNLDHKIILFSPCLSAQNRSYQLMCQRSSSCSSFAPLCCRNENKTHLLRREKSIDVMWSVCVSSPSAPCHRNVTTDNCKFSGSKMEIEIECVPWPTVDHFYRGEPSPHSMWKASTANREQKPIISIQWRKPECHACK